MQSQRLGIRGWGLGTVIGYGFLMMGPAVFGRDAVAAERGEHPTITVTIHDYAQVPSATLDEAKAVATRILRLAGLESSWRVFAVTAAAADSVPDSVRTRDEVSITLHTIPRSMAVRLLSGRLTLGLSVLPSSNKRGDTGYVFYHRVEELAEGGDASAGQALGHAMAHEIGHLLLNSPAHSRIGIMQAVWRGQEMKQLCGGRLFFTSEQSRQIRAEVLARQEISKALESIPQGSWAIAANSR